jgi:hypothetical protein
MPQHASRTGRPEWSAALSRILLATAVLSLALAGQPATGQDAPPSQNPPLEQVKALTGALDQPLVLLNEAKRKYAEVRDYTFLMQSQERVRGVMIENYTQCKVRTQPFSVYMRWLAPERERDQEVCYVAGRNNNKMRVRSRRLGNGRLLGWMSVDTNDPRVMEHSRHTIQEAGLGHLIDQTIAHMDMENKLGKTQVKIAEYNCNNRRAIRIDTVRTERLPQFYCYRSVLYLDAETKLPLRTENYDWPRAGGAADGDLLEMFSYVDLRLNVGLTDQDFNK